MRRVAPADVVCCGRQVSVWQSHARTLSLISSKFISDLFLQMSAYSNSDTRPPKCKLLSLTHITSVASRASTRNNLILISLITDLDAARDFINASGNHPAPVVWDKKRRRRRRAAFHRIFFFLIIPKGIQLQQCLEISEITVYLRGKKKQSEPIWFPALAEDASL